MASRSYCSGGGRLGGGSVRGACACVAAGGGAGACPGATCVAVPDPPATAVASVARTVRAAPSTSPRAIDSSRAFAASRSMRSPGSLAISSSSTGASTPARSYGRRSPWTTAWRVAIGSPRSKGGVPSTAK